MTAIYKTQNTAIVHHQKSWAILFSSYPTRAVVLQPHWIDITDCRDKEIILRYCGGFVAKDDLDARATVHIVSKKHWGDNPALGRLFYGLISYIDDSTPSDIIKNANIVEGTIIHAGSTIVRGAKTRHTGYYLSYPVETIGNR